MPISVVFRYEARDVKAQLPSPPTVLKAIEIGAQELGIPNHSFDIYDRYGKIEEDEDLRRAIHMAGTADCTLRVKEHEHYRRLRDVESRHDEVDRRLNDIERAIRANQDDLSERLEAARVEATSASKRISDRIDQEVMKNISALFASSKDVQKEQRIIQEKLSQIDVAEMQRIATQTVALRDEVRDAVRKVNDMQESWPREKARLEEMCVETQKDLYDLQQYFQGKIDVVISADADLRREQQLVSERMGLIADDVRLVRSSHDGLEKRCSLALEENDELRTLVGALREDSEHLKSDHGQVRTRVCVLEGSAEERWKGFCPGVLYFKTWHRFAKGDDVYFNNDMTVATGRGFLAATGMVCGNIEGLAVADGPCRRFGTPGCFSSYYEVEVDEMKAVPDGMGGLWVGFALQSSDEIAAHRTREFDGWLVGGYSKAMVCRAGTDPDMPVDKLPATFAPGVMQDSSVPNVKMAMELLRKALPPRLSGEMREFGSNWNSQTLRIGDRVGVLWRSNRTAGARLRVSVNGSIVLTQEFMDAPTAEAVGFFTPIVRLAGSGKAVRLCPGVTPPAKMLADD